LRYGADVLFGTDGAAFGEGRTLRGAEYALRDAARALPEAGRALAGAEYARSFTGRTLPDTGARLEAPAAYSADRRFSKGAFPPARAAFPRTVRGALPEPVLL